MVKKINARDCVLNVVFSDVEEKFLEENHLQGSALSIIAYGLYFDDELVQVMSFGRPRFNDNFQWEIIRDCTKKGCVINGGTSKLWNHFIKNNNVRSCICYSYPHNGEFTNKYVDYCDFNNVKKFKPEKKIYFESIWNGELRRIDKSILEQHGDDRLLNGDFGQDRTNEQILLDLGFEKKYEDGYSPQVDSYFPYGVLYKITDLDTGNFILEKQL